MATNAPIVGDGTLVTGLGGPGDFGEIQVPRGDDNRFAVDLSAVFESGLRIGRDIIPATDAQVFTNGVISLAPANLTLGLVGNPGTVPATRAVIAPFWDDLITSRASHTPAPARQIHVDVDAASDIVTFTWEEVPNFSGTVSDPLVSFQVQMYDRGAGDFDLVFRYADVGTDGSSPGLGWSLLGQSEILPAQGDQAATDALETTLGNTGQAGLWVWEFRSIRGTDGAETLTGTAGDDVLIALGGDDRLEGLEGDDVLDGGAGADTLDGGAGQDIAEYFDAGPDLIVDLQYTAFNTGDATGDVYIGIEGLAGGANADLLRGDTGNNVLQGGAGNDWLFGRQGADRLEGGLGDDVLDGGAGEDTLDGGSGIDTARYRDLASGVRVDLGHGDLNARGARGDVIRDVENVDGTAFDDNIAGDFAANHLRGGAGNDWLFARFDNDTLDGGAGDDVLTGTAAQLSFNNRFLNHDTFVFDGGADEIRNFDDDADTIEIESALLAPGTNVLGLLFLQASVVGGDTVIDFGGGNSLTIADYTDIGGLVDDVLITY